MEVIRSNDALRAAIAAQLAKLEAYHGTQHLSPHS